MRARNIKPSLFKNEILATADPIYSWVFAGLWCLADREGRLEDRPRRIHLEINPGRAYDGTESALAWLADQGFLIRYAHSGKQYIQVVNFRKHQNPHVNESGSSIPAPAEVAESNDIGSHGSPQHQSSTEVAPEQHRSDPADSLIPSSLIPSSLIPDSPSLIPNKESPSLRSGAPVRRGLNGKGKTVEKVFQHWRDVWGHPKASLDTKRAKLIGAALDAYDEASLCQCISGYRNSPHHMGENDRGTLYDSIDLFLRDAKHIDAGIKFHAEPPRRDLSSLTRRNVEATSDWEPPEIRNAKQ